jgi:hypothetical protein
MSVSEDLKQTAQLRKAIAPLVKILKSEADADITKRLVAIESIVQEIAKKETVINVAPPEVNVKVETPDELTKTFQKFAEPEPIESPTAYEPHDQAKKGIYQYSGFVRSDGKYYIQRVAKGEQRYSLGEGNYSDAWEKKDSLTYTRIDGSK